MERSGDMTRVAFTGRDIKEVQQCSIEQLIRDHAMLSTIHGRYESRDRRVGETTRYLIRFIESEMDRRSVHIQERWQLKDALDAENTLIWFTIAQEVVDDLDDVREAAWATSLALMFRDQLLDYLKMCARNGHDDCGISHEFDSLVRRLLVQLRTHSSGPTRVDFSRMIEQIDERHRRA